MVLIFLLIDLHSLLLILYCSRTWWAIALQNNYEIAEVLVLILSSSTKL